MTFDEKVAALRGKVVAKRANKKKSECTPEQWAAILDGYAAHRDPQKNRESSLKHYHANKEKSRAKTQLWRSANRDKNLQRNREWKAKNKEAVREMSRKWQARVRQSDSDFKLRQDLRNRLNQAMKGNAKKGSAVSDLGCSIAELWAHLESQFKPGMTKGNWGTVWEIDHIYPLAKANLKESRVEFLAANNWRNLQPLTPDDNNIKNDTITPEAQTLFDGLVREFTNYGKEVSDGDCKTEVHHIGVRRQG